MTQPRWAGAWKRAPILPERHADWTAPRLLRKAETPARQTVPPPHAKPVPPPREHSVPALRGNPTLAAGDLMPSAPEREYAVAAAPRLASPAVPYVASPSPAQPSPPRAAVRAGFGRFPALLIICMLGVATGLGAAYLMVRMLPGVAERMTASIDSAVSGLGRMRAAQAAAEAQGHGSAKIVPLPALPATADNAALETLLQRARAELAARKLEQPPGDNALDSYRQLRVRWPEEKRVAQLGGEVGLAFWAMGKAAQSTGDWNEALHYFKIVNSLPPLPLGPSSQPATASAAQ